MIQFSPFPLALNLISFPPNSQFLFFSSSSPLPLLLLCRNSSVHPPEKLHSSGEPVPLLLSGGSNSSGAAEKLCSRCGGRASLLSPPPPPPPLQPQPQRHPHHQQPQPPTNGMLPNTNNDPRPSQLLYPHNSAPSAVSSPLETGVRRKRGRPRKYGTPEQAAAAKRLSSSSSPSTSVPPLSPPRKKDLSLGVGGSSTSTSFKKSSLGHGFESLHR